MHTPRIFISTVTREFAATRQRVAAIVTRLGYQPVWEEIFGFESGDLRAMLREKIDSCEGLIQVAGDSYGAEPPESEFGRVSYTQYEFLYARQTKKKTWLILPGPGCRRDTPPESLDLPPPEPPHPDPAKYQAARRELQRAYVQARKSDGHLYYETASDVHLDLQIERLRDELAVLRSGMKRFQHVVYAGIAAALLVGAVVIALQYWNGANAHQLVKKVEEGLKISPERIRAHLLESSDQKRKEDFASAENEKKSDDRERLRDAAEKAHAARIARIDELVQSVVALESRTDTIPVMREMLRILDEEGVDKALAYAERQKPALLERVKSRTAVIHEQNRADLQPLLKAAELNETKGNATAARAGYRQVLGVEPDWPDALEAYAWFLFVQSYHAEMHGTLKDALADASELLAHATHANSLNPTDSRAQRLLSTAHTQMSDVLATRDQPGDLEAIVEHSRKSLEIREGLLKANPDSAEAKRDVSASLNDLADLLSRRGLPGDADNALTYYTRCLEVLEALLKANPDSARAARDVSVSLNNLADFLARRGLPGDADNALTYYTRCLEVLEALLKANPDSARAARDVSVSLNNLTDFLVQRGLPGNADNALTHYQRALEISETLLKANPNSAQAQRDVSIILNTLADFLAQRGLPGDADNVLTHYQRALQISETLLKANSDSAQAQRDVWLSCSRMAKQTEKTDPSGARKWWQRTYDILNGMKQKGQFIPKDDERFIEVLKQKLGL